MLQIQKRNQNWLPSIFDELFWNDGFQNEFSARPSMNVVENDNEYRVEFAAAGFKKEDASVSLENDQLVISLKQKEEKETSNKYLRHEFVQRDYRQSFELSDDVNREKISASLENGILTVILPKHERKAAEAARQIAIC